MIVINKPNNCANNKTSFSVLDMFAVVLILLLGVLATTCLYNKAERFEQEQESSQSVIEIPVAEMDKPVATKCNEVYYDIPLRNEYQDYVFNLCEKYDISPTMIFAIMWQESKFDFMAVSKSTQCVGIMQVNRINYDELNSKLGVTDLTKPKQNIESGIYLYSRLLHKYNDAHKALVCYNCGESGGKDILKNSYSSSVINYEKHIKKE